MGYQPRLGDFARHQLDRLPLSLVDTLLDRINEISEDPHRDLHLRVTLVVPLYRTFPGAYLCALWAIGFTVFDDLGAVVIEALGDTFY